MCKEPLTHFKCFFFYINSYCIVIQIWLKFIDKNPTDNDLV